MSASTHQLTSAGIRNGVWHGFVEQSAGGDSPDIAVTLFDQDVPGVRLSETENAGVWSLEIQIPTDKISDGAQVFVISERTTNAQLGYFTVLAGETVSDDVHGELALLRAELDTLKRAFRRHCAETS